MTYTLLGAPAVGFDLARLRGGARVAAVLRVAATAESEVLGQLAARHPGPVRESWQKTCELAVRPEAACDGVGYGLTRLRDVLPGVARSLAPEADEAASSSAVLRRLETGLVGDLPALRRLVSHELMADTWRHVGDVFTQDPEAALAADVLVDAATSAYVGDAVPSRLRRAMSLPYVGARVPVRDETVPTGMDVLDERLAVLADADARVRMAWRGAVDRHRANTAAWAPAMHQATWALHLTGRLQLGLDAQMAAVGAFVRAGFTTTDAAHGVWNALSGVVQATLVADLLPDRYTDLLLAPWREIHEH